ncbi:hypothetical protein OJAV_G00211510 [Oryzias javanicus]|uniref:tRNA (adenine(58)-N(1))-methyltransferase n=1 Tax=Oryzias javanicus TaxID=123683 RepID=A0A3S2MDC2_ORYJA|nr:hypothetical protein OJAV_G00211510 [Oryzias javanicus]
MSLSAGRPESDLRLCGKHFYETHGIAKKSGPRRRHLSPLERISSLLPQEVLSPEVEQLREQTQQEQDGDTSRDFTQEAGTVSKLEDLETHVASEAAEVPNTSFHDEETLPGECFLTFGELVIAEYRKKRRVEFRKMFQLEAGSRLQSSWGIILHDDIAGQPAGCFLKTSRGVSISIRRASLEDYVLYMKRGPAIAYPKDAANMLMMMDVTEGDCVLESGSGSGAMSLFLSRAVGSKGSVLSLEVRKDHHKRSVLNYERWRKSWSLHRREQWPDNVEFHNADLCTASPLLSGRAFNAIALDMIRPHLALPTVLPHLYPGAVCAVYLANITQKDGQFHTKQAPTPDDDETDRETEEPSNDGGSPSFGRVPYIARPHPAQMSHTAFLVKLRKYRH